MGIYQYRILNLRRMDGNEYKVIGVMSGTSLDGIDLVYAEFKFEKNWTFKLIYSETVAYDNYWQTKLGNLVAMDIRVLRHLDDEYTTHLSQIILSFIKKYKIEEIDLVSSHGHTALHQPEKRLTYQIGNLTKIASLVGNTVVCDFRVQDVELGGQGAPLVPIGDELLFSEFDYCINLGGFANISTKNYERLAYDVCPVNIVLNHYVRSVELDYDEDGKLASKGQVNLELLNRLNALSFYKELPPKSLGLEWVHDHILPLINSYKISLNDILRTFTEHIAIQVSKSISYKPQGSVLMTGGGAYNLFLVERIKEISENNIVIPSKEIVEFKEALIFGFLGVLRIRNEINCLKSVTGASQNHSSGNVCMP